MLADTLENVILRVNMFFIPLRVLLSYYDIKIFAITVLQASSAQLDFTALLFGAGSVL
jgi:hypothetical protein